MDWDESAEIENLIVAAAWVVKFTEARGPKLAGWISKFHPDNAPCEIEGEQMADDMYGSFNWVCKVRFTTGEVWAVRFPRGGKVAFPDEKIEAEVAAIQAIRQHTDIPVPEIKAWGLSADNELGLGPFMMSAFMGGVSLKEALRKPAEGRFLRGDLSDTVVETIYRQIARFMLQLWKLNFDHIGSLHHNAGGQVTTGLRRPLTLKANEILQSGGVDVFAPVGKTFSSSVDYFEHICQQDLQHLRAQLNSVDDQEDATTKFAYWNVMPKLIPRFTSPEHEHGPFKLYCDDFTPLNMLVDNTEDLNITAVLDWEWSYAGPQEFFWSPPRWLVGEMPGNWEKSDDHVVERYNRYLDIYIRMVQEQEQNVLGTDLIQSGDRPSQLLRKFQKDGAMWFYHILRECFNGTTSTLFNQLRASVPDFDKLADEVPKDEVDDFVRQKMEDLERYPSLAAEKKKQHAELIAATGWTGND